MTLRRAGPNELSVLNVNLHCFQESDPFGKLDLVARTILQLDPDVVTLQEAAQDRWAPVRFTVPPKVALREGNAAVWLVERLKREGLDYHGAWDWAHYGWDRWEEGCAILSRHKFQRADSRYITRSSETTAWKSRKPVSALLDIAGFGPVAVFSCHLGGWGDAEEPFEDMLDTLTSWQAETVPSGVPLISVGDFNVAAGTEGHEFLLDWTSWSEVAPSTTEAPQGDYIFVGKETPLEVVATQTLFTEPDQRVSNHVGLYALLRR